MPKNDLKNTDIDMIKNYKDIVEFSNQHIDRAYGYHKFFIGCLTVAITLIASFFTYFTFRNIEEFKKSQKQDLVSVKQEIAKKIVRELTDKNIHDLITKKVTKLIDDSAQEIISKKIGSEVDPKIKNLNDAVDKLNFRNEIQGLADKILVHDENRSYYEKLFEIKKSVKNDQYKSDVVVAAVSTSSTFIFQYDPALAPKTGVFETSKQAI